jgi:hypothetical protein
VCEVDEFVVCNGVDVGVSVMCFGFDVGVGDRVSVFMLMLE